MKVNVIIYLFCSQLALQGCNHFFNIEELQTDCDRQALEASSQLTSIYFYKTHNSQYNANEALENAVAIAEEILKCEHNGMAWYIISFDYLIRGQNDSAFYFMSTMPRKSYLDSARYFLYYGRLLTKAGHFDEANVNFERSSHYYSKELKNLEKNSYYYDLLREKAEVMTYVYDTGIVIDTIARFYGGELSEYEIDLISNAGIEQETIRKGFLEVQSLLYPNLKD